MTHLGQVAALWRYPVSSLAGQPMSELFLGPGGAEGDRLYGLFDVASGRRFRFSDEKEDGHGPPPRWEVGPVN